MKHSNNPDTKPAEQTTDIEISDPDLEEISLAPAKKPKKKKRIVLIVIAAIIVLLIGFMIVNNVIASSAGLPVSVAAAATGSVEETISTSGFVKSEQTKTYFAPVAATVKDFNYKVGDTVSLGDKLVTFDTADLELAAQKASLTATSSNADYQHNISANSDNKSDYEIASQNVEIYKMLIVAQRNYINDINYAIANKTYDVAQSAQCVRDGLQKKLNTKNEESANISKEINSISQNAISNPNDPQHQHYVDLQNSLLDIGTEKSKLSGAMSETSNLVNTSEESRQLAQAQNLLADMEGYLAKDQSKMDAAKKAILDANQKEKLKADTAITELSATQAQSDLAVAQTGVSADFNGIVTDAPVSSGASVAKGAALLTVESTQDVYVDITVTKYNLDKIALGQSCDITIAGNAYKGSITKINKKAQNNAQGTPVITAQVHIDNPDDTIFLGVEAKVIIHVAKADNVLLAPVEALNSDNSGTFCYIVKDGIVTRCNVTSGVTSDTFIEVVSGLKQGDLLINDYSLDIEEGMKVNPILPDDSAASTDNAVSADSAASTDNTASADGSVLAGAAAE